MGFKTKKMIQLEEDIKKRIVAAHRAGICDKEGGTLPHPKPNAKPYTPKIFWTIGENPPIHNWPRDANGNLIGDD